MKKRYYFAYGSNCNLEQMACRCPNAHKVEPVTLYNYELTFNGNGRRTGVANIHEAIGATVQGLLWEITMQCEISLDRYEGYPYLYDKKTVNVYTGSGKKVKEMVYVMTDKYSNPALPPDRYFQGIIHGFTENDMDTIPIWDALKKAERECDRESLVI